MRREQWTLPFVDGIDHHLISLTYQWDWDIDAALVLNLFHENDEIVLFSEMGFPSSEARLPSKGQIIHFLRGSISYTFSCTIDQYYWPWNFDIKRGKGWGIGSEKREALVDQYLIAGQN